MPLSLPSASDVRVVIKTTLTDLQIDAIIADAALLAEGCPVIEGFLATRQAAIVKWLTAHMLASTNAAGGGALTSKSLGDASEDYARPTLGSGLSGTTYGMQALALDTSGCLAGLGKINATFRAL